MRRPLTQIKADIFLLYNFFDDIKSFEKMYTKWYKFKFEIYSKVKICIFMTKIKIIYL